MSELKIMVSDAKKLNTLDQKLIDEFEMEIDDDSKFISVEDMVIGYAKVLEDDEFKDSQKRLKNEVMEFKPFLDKGYFVTQCSDYLRGGCYGMGYLICNESLEYKGFIRTI